MRRDRTQSSSTLSTRTTPALRWLRRRSAEEQRLRVHDAARDHFAESGSDQASAVARRTYATWR